VFLEIRKDGKTVRRFLQYYRKGIKHYFPEFIFDNDEGSIPFLVLRNLNIASIFIRKLMENGSLYDVVNYKFPKLRDFKIGKFIY